MSIVTNAKTHTPTARRATSPILAHPPTACIVEARNPDETSDLGRCAPWLSFQGFRMPTLPIDTWKTHPSKFKDPIFSHATTRRTPCGPSSCFLGYAHMPTCMHACMTYTIGLTWMKELMHRARIHTQHTRYMQYIHIHTRKDTYIHINTHVCVDVCMHNA